LARLVLARLVLTCWMLACLVVACLVLARLVLACLMLACLVLARCVRRATLLGLRPRRLTLLIRPAVRRNRGLLTGRPWRRGRLDPAGRAAR
jgi:hypothetical protein